jgi:hypothetical protein
MIRDCRFDPFPLLSFRFVDRELGAEASESNYGAMSPSQRAP